MANPAGQRTVLIAEDEAFLRKILTETFQFANYKVLEAADGVAALNLALTQHPDVSLLDIMMPQMDGLEVLQRLRMDAWGKTAMLIMLTNLTADNQVLQRMAQTPPSYYFVKANMEPDQLVAKVNELLAPGVAVS